MHPLLNDHRGGTVYIERKLVDDLAATGVLLTASDPLGIDTPANDAFGSVNAVEAWGQQKTTWQKVASKLGPFGAVLSAVGVKSADEDRYVELATKFLDAYRKPVPAEKGLADLDKFIACPRDSVEQVAGQVMGFLKSHEGVTRARYEQRSQIRRQRIGVMIAAGGLALGGAVLCGVFAPTVFFAVLGTGAAVVTGGGGYLAYSGSRGARDLNDKLVKLNQRMRDYVNGVDLALRGASRDLGRTTQSEFGAGLGQAVGLDSAGEFAAAPPAQPAQAARRPSGEFVR